jgi:hypothetical protein
MKGTLMARSRFFSTMVRVGACGTAIAAMVVTTGAPAGAATSPNLIKNGTAEAGAGGTGGVVNVPGWTRTTGTTFTAVKYGASGGFPTTSSPGPGNRGKNFFAGGTDSQFDHEVATQTISLASYANKIKAGGVTATAAGWFGGFGSQADYAFVEIDFKNGSGGLIPGGFQVGNVTAAQRNNVTGLLHRLATKPVPKAARSVYVQLVLQREDGSYNDGYADNVTLTLAGV